MNADEATDSDAYPVCACWTCAWMHSVNPSAVALPWHEDECGICGRITQCTEPSNLGYLKESWRWHRAVMLLHEFVESGVEFEDERIGYKVMQVPSELINKTRQFLNAYDVA